MAPPRIVSASPIMHPSKPRTYETMPPTPRFLAPGDYDPVKAKQRVRHIIRALAREFPHTRTSLDYETPFQLLIATILSAQSTDVMVNKVTPVLFERYP